MVLSARRVWALICITALVFPLGSMPAWSAGPGCRLEGRVVGLDGRPAAAHGVILVDRGGDIAARVETGPDGSYAFSGLSSGAYALGVEAPDGALAPVAGPPTNLTEGTLVRRDVKLVETGDATPRLAPAAYGYTSGGWWASLSRTARIWTIVGIVVGTAAIVAAVSSNGETPASPSSP